jgi:hypothetical protein
MLEETEFSGLPSVAWVVGPISLIAPRTIGPRIVGLELNGANVFAALPDAVLQGPDGRLFHFRGGHRLWEAPELPAITYRPDDEPVEIVVKPAGLRLTGQVDPATGLRRSMALRVAPRGMTIVADHFIANEGTRPHRLAAWAISQFPLGGRAWLGLAAIDGARNDRQANRSVVLWPYTRLDDDRLHLGDDRIEIRTASRRRSAGPLKVGSPGGWLAYLREGVLFVKRCATRSGFAHADLGATAQVYCDARFLELETLGPLTVLGAGRRIRHRETWQLFAGVSSAGAASILDELAAGSGG